MLTVALLAGSASPLRAQLPPQAPSRSYSLSYNDNYVPTQVCGAPGVPLLGPGTGSYGCTAQGATYEAFAEVAAGTTRARSATSGGTLAGGGTARSWISSVDATWRDRLFVTAGAPASVEMTVQWTGTLNASVAAYPGLGPVADANATYYFQAFAPNLARLVPDYNVSVQAEARADYRTTDARTINDLQTFVIPLGAGLSYVDFVQSVDASAQLYSFLVPPAATFGASAVADMSHTGVFRSIVFRDASGGDITNSVTYTFANGTQVAPAAVVPEPGTWALLSTGLAGLASFARRRPRKA